MQLYATLPSISDHNALDSRHAQCTALYMASVRPLLSYRLGFRFTVGTICSETLTASDSSPLQHHRLRHRLTTCFVRFDRFFVSRNSLEIWLLLDNCYLVVSNTALRVLISDTLVRTLEAFGETTDKKCQFQCERRTRLMPYALCPTSN